jgi:hypothetical protein
MGNSSREQEVLKQRLEKQGLAPRLEDPLMEKQQQA